MAVTPEVMRTYLKENVDADLTFAWDDAGVDLTVQYAMAQGGYKRSAIFIGLADTKTEVRAAMKDTFGLDPADAANGASSRLQVVS